ncbi:MAG: ABC transporter permease [Ruminococcaceae bacterium]|nr:ABC transporter permease [Oscillospiraceae bacterium]
MNAIKRNSLWKRIGLCLVMPVAVYLFFVVLCAILGLPGYSSWSNLQVVLRTAVYNGFIAWAFAFNLGNGRFDFSIGSVMLLSTVIGAQLADMLGLGAGGMLLMFVLAGAVLGLVSGIMYVALQVSPMVTSIGMTMVYEAFTFILTDGNGIIMIGRNDLLVFATPVVTYTLCAAGLIVVVFLSRYTLFGYHFRALGSGQAVSVSTGIKEKRNAIGCYILAGVLMACAGVINFSILGTCAPKTGLSSSSYMMSAFLPMFIGIALSRYTDNNVGILIGALTQALITSGFTKLGMTSTLQSVLNAVIVLCFLFFDANSYRVAERKIFAEKRLRIQQTEVKI